MNIFKKADDALTGAQVKLYSLTDGVDRKKAMKNALAIRKMAMYTVMVSMAVLCFSGVAFATDNHGSEAIKAVVSVLGVITNALGILFVLVGLVRLVIAHSQEDSPGQQRASMFIATGLALLVVFQLLKLLNVWNWIGNASEFTIGN